MNENIGVKTSKKAKILLVLGIITMIISLVFLGIFTNALIQLVTRKDLGSALGVVLTLVLYFAPGGLISMLSILFNAIAFNSLYKPRPKIYKISFILSILLFVGYVVEFIVFSLI